VPLEGAGHVLRAAGAARGEGQPMREIGPEENQGVRLFELAAPHGGLAGLGAAAVLRKNPAARVLPFEQEVVKLSLNARDSVMTNAQALAAIGGGGTNCSAPLARLNMERAKVELVILVSDNESWVDATRRGATQTLREWEVLKKRCPQARLVCIDIQPYGTTQAAERHDIMNVGGFSDAVFGVMASFAEGKTGSEHWVGEIEKVSLAAQ